MVRRLRPYYANIQKRLTKSPKLYLRDTGLLHFLAGLRAPKDLKTWPGRGRSWEGLVVEELIALAQDTMTRPGVYFWRTQAGGEVDLLIEDGERRLPIEIKLGASLNRHDLAGLRQCMKDLSLGRGWVVTGGEERRAAGHGIEIVPWASIVEGKITLREGLS